LSSSHTLRAALPRTAPPTPALHPLSLHDALPISVEPVHVLPDAAVVAHLVGLLLAGAAVVGGDLQPGVQKRLQLHPGVDGVIAEDRKSTRLNSSHVSISYAVFCLKKKNKHQCDGR